MYLQFMKWNVPFFIVESLKRISIFLSDIRHCSNELNLTFTDTLTVIQIENIEVTL